MLRRRSLPALLVGVALAGAGLSGCATGSTEAAETPDAATSADAQAFPVTIEHAFGSTEITEEPKRVATLGWSDQDAALALGVVPVGATKLTWGGNAQGSSDWFDAALEKVGGEQPVRYDDSDGAPVEEIAKLDPDVILATNSGITEQEYKKLSKIAPVVAYPEAPWVTPWQTSLETVGKALGRTSQAEEVAATTQQEIDAAQGGVPAAGGHVLHLLLPHHHRPLDDRHLRPRGPAGLVHARPRHGRRARGGRGDQARASSTARSPRSGPPASTPT